MSIPVQNTQPPMGVQASPVPKNGLGTTSLVMGILSVLGSWIPFVGFASYPMSIIGIVTGAAGRKRVKIGRATNSGAATGGLVMSMIGLASVILASVVYGSLLYAVSNSGSNTATNTHVATAATARIGDAVKDGKFTFTVTKVRTGVTHLGNSDFGQKAQGQFVIINVTVANHGTEAQTFDSSNQLVFDKANRQYSADGEAAIYLGDSNAFLNNINPGNTVKGMLVFDMPTTATPATIELHDSSFSGGVTVNLR